MTLTKLKREAMILLLVGLFLVSSLLSLPRTSFRGGASLGAVHPTLMRTAVAGPTGSPVTLPVPQEGEADPQKSFFEKGWVWSAITAVATVVASLIAVSRYVKYKERRRKEEQQQNNQKAKEMLLESAEMSVDTLQDTLVSLQSQLNDVRERNDSLQSQINEMRHNEEQLLERIAELESETDKLREEKERLERSRNRVAREREDLSDQIEALNRQLDELEAEKNQREHELRQIKHFIQNLETQRADLQTTVEKLQAEIKAGFTAPSEEDTEVHVEDGKPPADTYDDLKEEYQDTG